MQRNPRKMKQPGDMTGPLFQEAASEMDLQPSTHDFKKTPGLVLSKVEDPESLIGAKRKRLDAVHKKQHITGEALAAVQRESGLLALSDFEHNFGRVEPENLTVNNRSFSQALQSHLERRGVRSHFSSGVREITARAQEVAGVLFEEGRRIEAHAVVVAAGFETAYLVKPLGIRALLTPGKAYSLHIRNAGVAPRLKYAALLEADTHVLMTPYHDTHPRACG